MEIVAKDWELQLAAELPKIELHLHLDGSLSPGLLRVACNLEYENLEKVYLENVLTSKKMVMSKKQR